jgi:hypothetical protein
VDAPALSGGDGNYDSQKVQAQWLVRSVLEAAWSKSLDKMMLFELADNPTVGDNHYRFSGLLTDRYVAKRSWFYIMTLKNILGEYSFDKEIVDGYEVAPGFAFDVTTSSGDDVRIYEFRNDANAITYAIWSPTAEAIVPFTVEIKFPKNPTGNFEYHLNGEATLYFIQELNEKGKRRDWSQYVDVVNNKITNIPVSETPVFLRLNKAYPSHPSIPHVTNLTFTPGCCNAVDLAWQYAGTGLAGTRNHLVFYRERGARASLPGFQFRRLHPVRQLHRQPQKHYRHGIRSREGVLFLRYSRRLIRYYPGRFGRCPLLLHLCFGLLRLLVEHHPTSIVIRPELVERRGRQS